MALSNLVSIGPGNGLAPFGAKPLPEPMLTYHQLDPHKQRNLGEIWITKYKQTLFMKRVEISSAECQPYCPGLSVLTSLHWK